MKKYTKAPVLTTFEGRREWERKVARDFPVRYFLFETFPRWWHRNTVRRAKDAYWWFRHRFDPRTRFHVVHTGLKPGYYDQDERMLHACFALLSDFVEEKMELDRFARELFGSITRKGDGYGDEYSDVVDDAGDPVDENWDEAVALCDWWRNRDNDDPNPEKDDAMLRRLIAIRTYLWV